MNPAQLKKPPRKIGSGLAFISLVIPLILQLSGYQSAMAQTTMVDWAQPINISNSGASRDAEAVIDADGNIHIIWFDQFDGYRYARSLAEDGWSEPETVNFPFGEYNPVLIRGVGNSISAFWRDGENRLLTSQVFAQEFGYGVSWDKVRVLSNNVLAFDATTDSSGKIHVVYFYLADDGDPPSGIYNRHSIPEVGSWTDASLIYPSLYMRGVASEDFNLSVATEVSDGKTVVYAAWDDAPLSKIFLSRSFDAGKTWEAPIDITSTGEETGSTVPFGVNITTWSSQVVVTWKQGNPESNCSLRYQASTDQGATWQASGTVAKGLSGCAMRSKFLPGLEEALYWQVTINNQIYLIAWDGKRWSKPQVQAELSIIEDPSTERSLRFDLWDIVFSENNNSLVAVGCDIDGTRDTWFTYRMLGDLQSWFPPASAWKKPVEIFNSEHEVASLQLLSDRSGNFHSLWLESSGKTPNSEAKDSFYYAGYKEYAWSEPVTVFQDASGELRHLSAAITDDGKIITTWQNNREGKIFYSWANSDRAYISAEWAQPALIPETSTLAASPNVYSWNGIIYIVYVLPINEKRGVYLSRSVDDGKTWTAPSQVFDGQSAGWEVVGEPSIAVTYDGQIHVVWTKESLPGIRGSSGLYYASSKDNGDTWSNAYLITDNSVTWGRVTTTRSGKLYQIWHESDSPNIFHSRESSDLGTTWATSEALAGEGIFVGIPAIFADPTGKLYLYQFFKEGSSNTILKGWENQDGLWKASEDLMNYQESNIDLPDVTVAFSPSGTIAIVYTSSRKDPGRAFSQKIFNFTFRSVDLPAVLPTLPAEPAAEIEQSATLVAAAIPTSSPTATPTQGISPQFASDLTSAPRPADNSWTGLLISILLSGLLVAIGFVVLLLRKRFH